MALEITQKVKIKWSNVNKSRFEKLGYIYTGNKDEFEVSVSELSLNSRVNVNITCDFCNKIFQKSYKAYNEQKERSISKKDCCKQCTSLKNKEVFLEKYSVDSPMKVESIRKKREQNNIDKYGVKEVWNSKVVKQKTIETNLKKYGFIHASKSQIVKDKMKKTNLEKFGTEYTFQNEKVKEKIRKSLYHNGTAPCSKQQRYLHYILGGELNYPVNSLSLDIAFTEEMIYLEYDGSGHSTRLKFGANENNFNSKEARRNHYLKNLGWKRIRIISSLDYLPSKEIIEKYISIAKDYLNSVHSWFEINIDESTLRCSQYEKIIDLGELNRVKGDDYHRA